MAISGVGSNIYTDISGINAPATAPTAAAKAAADSTAAAQGSSSAATAAANSSSLSAAIAKALAQLNAGPNLATLLSGDSQDAASDFSSSLASVLPGLSANDTASADSLSGLLGNSSGQTVAPVKLDASSPTAKLQSSIQSLISQLDSSSGVDSLFGGDDDSSGSSSFGNLQQSFNTLLKASGGDPSQATLQTFLKSVATNIQASTSIGTILDASV